MNDFTPVRLGTDDPGEDVAIGRTPDGSALLLPVSVSRLTGRAADLVAELQRTAVAIHEAQLVADDLVSRLRAAGVSWGVIGWSVGTGADAARRRWSDEAEQGRQHRAPRRRRPR